MNADVEGKGGRHMRVTVFVGFLALFGVFASTVNARSPTVEGVALPGQMEHIEQGINWFTASGSITVSLSVHMDDSGHGNAAIVIANPGTNPTTVRDDDIRITLDGAPVHIVTREDLMKREKRRAFWEKFAVGLAAGLNSYNAASAGTSTVQGSFQGNLKTYGDSSGYSSSTYSGTYYAQITDPVAAQVARDAATRQNMAMFNDLAKNQEIRRSALGSGIFTSQTIPPSGIYTGRILFELPRHARNGRELVVTILDLPAPHEFHWFVDGPPSASRRTTLLNTDRTKVRYAEAAIPAVSAEATLQPPAEEKKTLSNATEPVIANTKTATNEPATGATATDIRATLVNKRASICPKSGGECLFIDLDWQIASSRKIVHAEGYLTLARTGRGEPLTLEWVIDNSAGEKNFTQSGIGFPLHKTGASAGWLVMDKPQTIHTEFQPTRIDFAP